MLIFSLGKSLQQVVEGAEYEQGKLKSVLESMVRANPGSRASLMDLLDVSKSYLQIGVYRQCASVCVRNKVK